MQPQEPGHPIGPVKGIGEEGDGLVDAVVGLGAAEADEAGSRGAEAFAAQAGDAELVVGGFEQIQSQTVRGQAQAVAEAADVGKDVEGAGGGRDVNAVYLREAAASRSTLPGTGSCSRHEWGCRAPERRWRRPGRRRAA